MRSILRNVTLAAGVLVATAAVAAEQIVPVVHSAEATYGPDGRTITIRATVDLPNACWSNPRLSAPSRGVEPDADGIVQIAVVADSSEGQGMMCAMIYRPGVPAPPLRWTNFPPGIKAIRVIGRQTPVTAPVTRPHTVE